MVHATAAATAAAGTPTTATVQPVHAQSAVQPQHPGGQGSDLAAGPELGRPRVIEDGGNSGGRNSTGGLHKAHPGPAHTTAPGEQGAAAAPGSKPPRSRRSGRRRKSSSSGALPTASESDSDDEDDDQDEGAPAAPTFGGVARKAQQICSDALKRLQQTARWSPEGSAALEHAFAGIVQVGSISTTNPVPRHCDQHCTCRFAIQAAAWASACLIWQLLGTMYLCPSRRQQHDVTCRGTRPQQRTQRYAGRCWRAWRSWCRKA
jgi:hypothetical protein